MPSSSDHLWIVVLAGGTGSRFWPVSLPSRPKQLLPLASVRPLIVDTVDRALGLVPPERLRILASEELARAFGEVLPGLGPDSYLLEPRARGTGPVLAWAAREIERIDPEAVMVSLHSDHSIEPVSELHRTLLEAARVAREERALVTVGVPPDRPETGYGYIRPGPALDASEGMRAYRVDDFEEKPGLETAREYVDAGYRWNSGIFVWRVATFLDEVRAHAPGIARALSRLDEGDPAGFFDSVEPGSVDEEVLERSGSVAGVEATFRWDDVGSWEALGRTRNPDEAGNVLAGPARVLDGSGNIVYAEDAPVVLWGVDDLVVVRTGGMTLVTPRGRSPELKTLLSRLPREWVELDAPGTEDT